MQNNLFRIFQLNHIKFLVFVLVIGVFSASCKKNEVDESSADAEDISASEANLTTDETPEMELTQPDTLAFCLRGGVGVGGYDPVSYFNSTEPQKGSVDIITRYQGIVYRFINSENKDIFLDDPDKYLPAYGGWCAMTLSMGRATTPVYDNFLIIDGTLHLYERTVSVNGRTLWQQDPELNAQRARKNYEDYKADGTILGDE